MSGPGEEAAGRWVEAGEAPNGLLLFAPETGPGPGFEDELAAVLATGGVVALVVAGSAPPAPAGWRERCGAARVAFLAHGGPDLAEALAADGVHLGDPYAAGEARRRLGPDALVGADCGGSRHAAMVAGEEGADYVMFGAAHPEAAADLCRWWTELFVLPCAADLRGRPGAAAADDIGPLVRAGADFVAVRRAVWEHPAGAVASALDLRRAMDEALRQRQDPR